MNYINVDTLEYPVTEDTIRSRHPNVSFPVPFEPTIYYAPVNLVPQPEIDSNLEKIVEIEPVYDENTGQWQQNWSIVELTTEEINIRTAELELQLSLVKEEQCNLIDNSWFNANQTTFMHDSKEFSCDALSRSNIDAINGYISLNNAFPENWINAWKATDNTYYPMSTIAEWKLFYTSMVTAGMANFAKAQTLKSQVRNSVSVEAVRLIKW